MAYAETFDDFKLQVENNAKTKRPRIGLALGGGGTRGVAHVGVLRALEKNNIPIDCIAGTSMGAIIGGLYAAGVPLDKIEKMLYDNSLVHSYDTVPIRLRLAVVPIFFVPHIFGYHPYDGLYRGNKFAKFISRTASDKNVESLPMPFCAVACNILDGKTYAIKSGNIGRAIQASSAIPGLRRPVPFEDKLFVDGGITANLPVEYARQLGADIVIAVNVDDKLTPPAENKNFHKIGSVSYRCLDIFLTRSDEHTEKEADFIVHPDVSGIGLLSRSAKDIKRAVKEGEDATKEALPAILAEIQKRSNEITLNNNSNDKQ